MRRAYPSVTISVNEFINKTKLELFVSYTPQLMYNLIGKSKSFTFEYMNDRSKNIKGHHSDWWVIKS